MCVMRDRTAKSCTYTQTWLLSTNRDQFSETIYRAVSGNTIKNTDRGNLTVFFTLIIFIRQISPHFQANLATRL
jgi:hypothetical protein